MGLGSVQEYLALLLHLPLVPSMRPKLEFEIDFSPSPCDECHIIRTEREDLRNELEIANQQIVKITMEKGRLLSQIEELKRELARRNQGNIPKSRVSGR